MRTPIIAANWKMYKNSAEAAAFISAFLPLVTGHTRDEIVLHPSPLLVAGAVWMLKSSNVAVGAQNLHWAAEGAFTGETSAAQIIGVGATHVLIGHSERRQYFGETDETVNKKLKAALAASLIPIVCVGEVLAERESGTTESVLRTQVTAALAGISAAEGAPIVIAYEPVWAIGTGKTATPEMAAEAHLIIRTTVAELLDRPTADALRILCGGSVKPENITTLMSQPEIDGALVGGASLDPTSFAKIVKY